MSGGPPGSTPDPARERSGPDAYDKIPDRRFGGGSERRNRPRRRAGETHATTPHRERPDSLRFGDPRADDHQPMASARTAAHGALHQAPGRVSAGRRGGRGRIPLQGRGKSPELLEGMGGGASPSPAQLLRSRPRAMGTHRAGGASHAAPAGGDPAGDAPPARCV